jgi:hypothetical protein
MLSPRPGHGNRSVRVHFRGTVCRGTLLEEQLHEYNNYFFLFIPLKCIEYLRVLPFNFNTNLLLGLKKNYFLLDNTMILN